MPLLERLQALFFNQLTYLIPHLQQFMGTAACRNLRLNTATLAFPLNRLIMEVYPHPIRGPECSLWSWLSAANTSTAGGVHSTGFANAQDNILRGGASHPRIQEALDIFRVE